MDNYVRCNLCNADNTELLFKNQDVQIVKCRICGLIYNNPQISINEEIYSEEYFKDYYAINDPQGHRVSDYVRGYDREKDLAVIEQLRGLKSSGRLLEIGCSFGFFLRAAKKAGYEVRGVEISKHAGRQAQESLGQDVFIGRLKDAGFPEGHFDIIYMIQTLEHVGDPIGMLKEANRILKKNGIALIEVPNEYYNLSRVIKVLRFKDFRPNNPPPFHLYYFSPRTISSILRKSGFTIINKRFTHSPIPDLEQSVNDLGYRRIGKFLNSHKTLEKTLSIFLRKFTSIFNLGVLMRIHVVKKEN